MKKIINFLDENFEKYFLIVSLVVMVLIITIQVIARFVGKSIIWTEELTRYIMLYQIWIGAAYAVKKDAHLRIVFLRDKLSNKKKEMLEIFVIILWAIFTIWLSFKGTMLVNILLNRNQLSPAMQIPMGYAYASVSIGCALMSIRLLQKLYQKFNEFFSEEVTEC